MGSIPGLGRLQHAKGQLSVCATTTEPVCCRLELVHLEPVLGNEGSHCTEKPARHDEEHPLLAMTGESPRAAVKTQCSHE